MKLEVQTMAKLQSMYVKCQQLWWNPDGDESSIDVSIIKQRMTVLNFDSVFRRLDANTLWSTVG